MPTQKWQGRVLLITAARGGFTDTITNALRHVARPSNAPIVSSTRQNAEQFARKAVSHFIDAWVANAGTAATGCYFGAGAAGGVGIQTCTVMSVSSDESLRIPEDLGVVSELLDLARSLAAKRKGTLALGESPGTC